MTEVACWLATAWTPLVLLPGATKLKVSATGAAGAFRALSNMRASSDGTVGAFTVLSNMRPSSDSSRGRSLGAWEGVPSTAEDVGLSFKTPWLYRWG